MRLIGINYCDYYGLSPDEFTREIKSVGFGATFTEACDIDEADRFANACAKNGIAWETIHAPFNGINDIWGKTERGDQILRQMKTTVDICARFSVPTAVIHLSSGEKAPTLTDIGQARFKELINHSVKKGVNLAFENQRKLTNISWVFEEFYAVPTVGFCWDVGHEGCFTSGREYMPLFGNKLISTHIHDNDGQYNHDLHQIPFDGKLDFYRIARYIKKYGFAGTLMLEIFPQISGIYKAMGPRDILLRAANAAERLRDMVDKKQFS